MHRLLIAVVLLLAGAIGRPALAASEPPLNQVALQYVRLALEVGEHEPGYIDAYFGAPEILAAAKANKRDLPTLARDTRALRAQLATLQEQASGEERRRADFLASQLAAVATRLRMLQGEKLSFVEEAEGLYGVRPELKPLASFEPVLARIDALVPGPGPLWERVDAFQNRFVIPNDRLERVMLAATAECRSRTAHHIAPPEGERFTLSLVTDKPWSGYNWFQGGSKSLIEINTDLPVRLSRAVDLGCHEGYPGHHLMHSLQEARLARGRGWLEFTVFPLFAPTALVAEGTANHGIDMAFPTRAERLTFERDVLAPLAGLPAGDIERYLDLLDALKGLAGARFTIAADYLDGRISRAEAVALTQRYELLSPARAEQRIAFAEKYRSYVINYGLGQDMAKATVDRAGADAEARWALFERLIAEPTTPADFAQP
jgi:hypothetical protein